MQTQINFFPRFFSKSAIIGFIIILGICSVVFIRATLPAIWALFAIIEVLGFFYFLNVLTRNWRHLSVSLFIRNLFIYSLVIRLNWVVFSYYFFIAQTGQPFEFLTGDALSYHNWASIASSYFSEKGYSQFFESRLGYSDLGYPMFLTTIYYIFGETIIGARLIFALLGAWSVILIYKLTKRNFGEHTGRIAGIMAMLFPNLIYYTGLHLKETTMVFLTILFFERADLLLRENKLDVRVLATVLLTGGVLFFFRTVLGVAALFALFSGLVFSSARIGNWAKRIFVSVWVLIMIWIFFSARIQYEVSYLVENYDTQDQNLRFRAEREGGNQLAEYGSVFVFVPFMFVAPFPTFVNIDTQQQLMLLSGGYFTRNIFAFFVILALIMLYKKKLLRRHIIVIMFTLAYLAILARSPYALSERFHLPVAPFLIILSAYGINQINLKNKKYFIPYLVLIGLVIIGWNWFKLAGRGII